MGVGVACDRTEPLVLSVEDLSEDPSVSVDVFRQAANRKMTASNPNTNQVFAGMRRAIETGCSNIRWRPPQTRYAVKKRTILPNRPKRQPPE